MLLHSHILQCVSEKIYIILKLFCCKIRGWAGKDGAGGKKKLEEEGKKRGGGERRTWKGFFNLHVIKSCWGEDEEEGLGVS